MAKFGCNKKVKVFFFHFSCCSEEEPLPSANYLEAGSELKVKIEIVHPLTTASEVQKRIREPSEVEVPSEVG